MKHLYALAPLLLAASFGACARQSQAQSHLRGSEWLGKKARIVWIGDSITHACRWTSMVESFLWTRYPGIDIRFWNAGVSGDRAGHVLQRLEGDILPFEPTHAFVMLGMNDGEVQDWSDKYFAIFERDIQDLVWKLERRKTRIALLSPTPFDPIARARYRPGKPVPHYDHVLARYGTWLRELALERGLAFVDTHAPLRAANLQLQHHAPKESLIPDGVHPGHLGSAYIALAIVLERFAERNDGGELYPRAAVNLELEPGEKAPILELRSTRAARVTEMKADAEHLEFTVLYDCLPWILPKESAQLHQLSAEYRRLNEVPLRVRGLAPGSYWIAINGQNALLRTARELSEGVDIGHIKSHPEHNAASMISWANGARNELIRKGIRDLWHARKMIPYYEESAPSKAASYRKKLQELQGKYESTLQQIATFREEFEHVRSPAPVQISIKKHGGS
jgi:lysophospholipase L1-like esterase